jgi:O-antigen ligase
LLRGRLWRGDGPDTFAAHFPQDDLVPKANAFGRLDLIVDKPHSLYLQMAVNTGLVSLLGLLLVLGHYLATGARLYLAYPAQGPLAGAGASLLAAAAGYAVAALFNDSVVSVAPVFWTLLGLGLAVNLAVAESGRRR